MSEPLGTVEALVEPDEDGFLHEDGDDDEAALDLAAAVAVAEDRKRSVSRPGLFLR